MSAPVINPDQQSAKKDGILAAALELFVERGFHGTAVPEIAERAKVGAGTIYRYFASKDSLVNAVYQKWKTAVARAVLDDFPGASPPREQFHIFWQRLAKFVLAHPRAFAFLELHHHGDYLDGESRAIEERVLAAAHAFLDHAKAHQAVKALDHNLLMAIVWGAFVGLVRASWEHRVKLDPATIDAAEECAWEAVRR